MLSSKADVPSSSGGLRRVIYISPKGGDIQLLMSGVAKAVTNRSIEGASIGARPTNVSVANFERQLMQIRAALVAGSGDASAGSYLADFIVDDLLASFRAIADENRELKEANAKLRAATLAGATKGRKEATNRLDDAESVSCDDEGEREPSPSVLAELEQVDPAVLEDSGTPLAVAPPVPQSPRRGRSRAIHPESVESQRRPESKRASSRERAKKATERGHVCTQCDRRLSSARALCLHVKFTHLKERDYACEICGKAFPTKHKIEEHTRTHTGEKPFECERCGLKFASKAHLPRHRRTCGRTREHANMDSSDDAEERTQSPSDVNDCEREVSAGDPEIVLEAPSRRSSGKKGASREREEKAPERVHICAQCDRRFSSAATLRAHVQYTHLKQLDYRCDMCGKAFANRYKLDEHVRTHTGEKPFECERCGSKFASKAHLPRHLRKCDGTGRRCKRKEGERKPMHACAECHRMCMSAAALQIHVKTVHLKLREHVCDLCGRAYAQAKDLEYHRNSKHTGERPFLCELCGKTFAGPSHLPRHRLTCARGRKPYTRRRPMRSAGEEIDVKSMDNCIRGAGLLERDEREGDDEAENNDI